MRLSIVLGLQEDWQMSAEKQLESAQEVIKALFDIYDSQDQHGRLIEFTKGYFEVQLTMLSGGCVSGHVPSSKNSCSLEEQHK